MLHLKLRRQRIVDKLDFVLLKLVKLSFGYDRRELHQHSRAIKSLFSSDVGCEYRWCVTEGAWRTAETI